MKADQPRFVDDAIATIGEGPLWSPYDDALYWIDTVNKKIYRVRPPFVSTEVRELPYRPSCVALLSTGNLLVAYKKGIGIFNFETGEAFQLELEGVDFEVAIFNDGKCDRAGRLWIGTRDRDVKNPVGSLYSIDSSLVAHRHAEGLVVSNGIAWSPDGRTIYHIDSRPGRIDAYDFDISAGTISNRRVFVDYAGKQGHGDGCTIDTQGCLWVAEVQGSRIARYTPDGVLDREIALPIRKPTSVMFGGPNMSTLFVTSMRWGLSETELAAMPRSGMLMALDVGCCGLPEPAFVISAA